MQSQHQHSTHEITDANRVFNESILQRLVGAANDLLDGGSSPSVIEMTIYKSLVAGTPSASLFRAGVGLAEPQARDFASRLAELIGRALRGPTDPDFARRYALAHLRGRLAQAAHDCAEQLRRDGVPVTPDDLTLRLMLAAMKHRPEAKYILGNPLAMSIEDQCSPSGK